MFADFSGNLKVELLNFVPFFNEVDRLLVCKLFVKAVPHLKASLNIQHQLSYFFLVHVSDPQSKLLMGKRLVFLVLFFVPFFFVLVSGAVGNALLIRRHSGVTVVPLPCGLSRSSSRTAVFFAAMDTLKRSIQQTGCPLILT